MADDISSDDLGSSSDESNASDGKLHKFILINAFFKNIESGIFLSGNFITFLGDCVDEPPLDSNDDETGPSVEETFDTGLILYILSLQKFGRKKLDPR